MSNEEYRPLTKAILVYVQAEITISELVALNVGPYAESFRATEVVRDNAKSQIDVEVVALENRS